MSSNKSNVLITRSATNVLRILFEALVLFHHLFDANISWLNDIDSICGPTAVSGFLLISGFGLGMRYKKDGEKYLGSLLKKRIPTTYFHLVLTNVCYLALFFICGESFDNAFSFIISVLYLPVFKDFVYLSNWVYFLADLLLYYVMFLLFGWLMRKKKNALLKSALWVFALQALVVLVLECINASTGSAKAMRGCFLFPIGLICANFNEVVADFVKEYKYLVVAMFFSLGCVGMHFMDSNFMFEYVTSACFCMGIVCLFHGFNFETPGLALGAKAVLFVYLSHEFALKFFRHIMQGADWWLHSLFAIDIVVCLAFLYVALIVKRKGRKKLKI